MIFLYFEVFFAELTKNFSLKSIRRHLSKKHRIAQKVVFFLTTLNRGKNPRKIFDFRIFEAFFPEIDKKISLKVETCFYYQN